MYCFRAFRNAGWKNTRVYVGEKRDDKCYAFEFLPKMEGLVHEFIDSYLKEKGGDPDSASETLSSLADKYTLAKLMDEYNYVRYSKGKSLEEIRDVSV